MSESPQKAQKRAPDWERIEFDYRAGIKTLRQIADEHGVTHGAVNKRAKTRGWSRDLSVKIQAKIAEKVSKAAVSSEVSKQREIAERDVIEANAARGADILIAQQKDIQRSRRVVMELLTELENEVGGETVAMLQQLGDLMRAPDKNGVDKLNDLYHKVISLPGRAKTMKDLGDSLEKLVKLERQAFGLDVGGGEENPQGGGKPMTDVERAVRLMHFIRSGAQQ